MKKNSFKIYTLGCKVNQHDSGSIAAKLRAAGFAMGKNNVDLAIINTCAVTKSALRKGRQMINRARRENPKSGIVIVGCAVKAYKEDVGKWGADLVIEGNNVEQLVEKIFNFQFSIFKQFSIFPAAAGPRQGGGNFQTGCNASIAFTDKSRYFLKIQDGCRQFCSYCIIPYARGELQSRSLAEVLTETQAMADAGTKEIVLCGIHLGQFGIDRKTQNTNSKTQTNLTILLKKLIKIKKLERIRLSSIEVNEVTAELIDLIKNERKLCRHLHIPLQAGNDKILKLMNRPYTTKIFADKIKKLRKIMPDIAITTDVIVGFPGETEMDFQKTVEFIKKINFSKVHVFPFSAHERTPAAKMPDQVEGAVKSDRVKRLNNLNCYLEKIYAKRFVGKSLTVIVDGRINGARFRGRTEYNFNIKFSSGKKYRQGELVPVKNWELL